MIQQAELSGSRLTRKEAREVAIGIVTALPKEYAAMAALLDRPRKKRVPGKGAGRSYLLGKLAAQDGGKHTVALVLAAVGNNSAAVRAALLLEHFPNVSEIIMVGIAGGIPNPRKPVEHVRLGDIVVSNSNGVVQYDFGKETDTEITYRHPPRPPSASLLEAVRLLEAAEISGQRPWLRFIKLALEKLQQAPPPETADILGDPANDRQPIPHPEDPARMKGQPRIFFGPIASANLLLRNAKKRDELRDRFGVIAVEMEASGIADATWNREAGYLVVRGICDYCDSRKNDVWQDYAAVVAAAYTRALIESMPGHPESARRWRGSEVLAIAALMVFALLLPFAMFIHDQPQSDAEAGVSMNDQKPQIYVRSQQLPVEIYCDGVFKKTLNNSTPATTLDIDAGEHTVVAKWERFSYEEKISLTRDTSPHIIIIPRGDPLP